MKLSEQIKLTWQNLRRARAVAIVLLLLIVVILTLQNTAVVTLHLFGWQLRLSLALLIFICWAIGFLMGLILPQLRKHRL